MPESSSSDVASLPSGRSWERFAFWGILIGALLLRLFWLGMKPPHFDEGVNGFFVDRLRETGLYRYDPENYHGPLHFYVLFLMQTLFGRSIEVLRLPLVAANVATVWLVLEFRRFLPWRLCAWAAAALAVSPAMLFYSRYAIHEAWLVLALVLLLWGAAELWRRGTRRGLWAMVMGATLAVLTKETYLLHFVAFGLAWLTLLAFERWITPSAPGWERAARQRWTRGDLGAALATGGLLTLFFYSGGFRDFRLLSGMVETFHFWGATGTDGDHSKPFYYWLELMVRHEPPLLAGAALTATALLPGMHRLVRFIAIWGCGVLVAYSLIPYKTPWCIIAILWPFAFLFGEAAVRYGRGRQGWIVTAVLAVLLGRSLGEAITLNYFRPTDPKHDYVYVQTTNDLALLTGPLMAKVRETPTTLHAPIHVFSGDYHPLPWVLGDFTRVGFYPKPEQRPQEMDALAIIAEEGRVDDVESALRQAYFVFDFRLRNEWAPGRLYLNADAFAPYLPGRQPELNAAQWYRNRAEAGEEGL